jgi:hypothetical protein
MMRLTAVDLVSSSICSPKPVNTSWSLTVVLRAPALTVTVPVGAVLMYALHAA